MKITFNKKRLESIQEINYIIEIFQQIEKIPRGIVKKLEIIIADKRLKDFKKVG